MYFDGSILVTHGGLEVGQGLTTKVKQASPSRFHSGLGSCQVGRGSCPVSTTAVW